MAVVFGNFEKSPTVSQGTDYQYLETKSFEPDVLQNSAMLGI